jgi:hypothetical protein
MQDDKHGPNFWLGNGLLALALVTMFFLGALWEALGVWAMGLWMGLAGAGMYFVMKDKGPSSNMPD